MKLNEKNASYAVVRKAIWNGGVISYHNSFEQAIKTAKKYCYGGFAYVEVVAITDEAVQQIDEAIYQQQLQGEYRGGCFSDTKYSELKPYNPNMRYYQLAL
jgi:hypothetical protein